MSARGRRVFPPWMRFWAWLTTSRPTSFLDGRLFASRAPEAEDIKSAHKRGVRLVINMQLLESPHAALYGELAMSQLHLPVPDLTAPTQDQLSEGVGAIRVALERGDGVLVHCAAGLGRTGTLLACYLVSTGMTAPRAMSHVRKRRPGSIETADQEAAVELFARAFR